MSADSSNAIGIIGLGIMGHTMAQALIAAGYQVFGFDTDPAKRRAIALETSEIYAPLAERIGMRREAHYIQDYWFKGEWTDSFIYAVLESEWQK